MLSLGCFINLFFCRASNNLCRGINSFFSNKILTENHFGLSLELLLSKYFDFTSNCVGSGKGSLATEPKAFTAGLFERAS